MQLILFLIMLNENIAYKCIKLHKNMLFSAIVMLAYNFSMWHQFHICSNIVTVLFYLKQNRHCLASRKKNYPNQSSHQLIEKEKHMLIYLTFNK